MKIAITIWGNRISPVFDAAKTLLITEIENGMVINKEYLSFDPHLLQGMINLFKEKNISALVCGAISTRPAETIVEHDIRLFSFVMGNAQNFLDSFTGNNRIEKSFIMPGCEHDSTTLQQAEG